MKKTIISTLLALTPLLMISCSIPKYNISITKEKGSDYIKKETTTKTETSKEGNTTVITTTTTTNDPVLISLINENSQIDFWKLRTTAPKTSEFITNFNNSTTINSKFSSIDEFWNKWKHLDFSNSATDIQFLSEFEDDVNFKPENGERIVAACFNVAAHFDKEEKQVKRVAYFIKSKDGYHKLVKNFG